MIKQQKSRALDDLKRIIFHLDYKMVLGLLRRESQASLFALEVINRKLYCNTLCQFLQREINAIPDLTNESLLSRLREERKYLLLLPIIHPTFRGKSDIDVLQTIGFRLQKQDFDVRLRLQDSEITDFNSIPRLLFARESQIQSCYRQSSGAQIDIMSVFAVLDRKADITSVYKVFAEAGIYLLFDNKTNRGGKIWYRFSFYSHGLTPESELASAVNIEQIEL